MYKIKVILLASLLLLPLSALAQTEVPHTFTDGTPALAAEVNENFDALADEVNAQDVRIKNVENVASVNLPHTFTYTKNDQEAGYEFQVGGVDYRLVDLPVYEYSTGDRYVVRYPLIGEYTNAHVTFGHKFGGSFTSNGIAVDIDGYEGVVQLSEGMSYSIGTETPYEDNTFVKYSSCSLSLTILETGFLVGDWNGTSFNNLFSKRISEDISPQDTSANSYVDSVPAPPERDPDLVRTACDDLIDYIQVFGPSQARDTSPSTQQATNID